jgi:gliding motility-associated-like protein
MKYTFTNSKRSFLFVLLFYAVFTSQEANAQAVTEIITDYQGYWKSGSSNLNPVKPENSHDLLSFTYNGTRYSTGVNDALLATEGNTFSPQLFMALNMENMSGTPTNETFIGLGQLYDGVDNGASTPPPFNSIPFYLTDGNQGLNLGTCVANIPLGYVSFQVTEVNPASVGDGIPDILITQIAQPSGATDTYQFKDSNGNTVGTAINIVLNNITPVGNWIADFYKVNSNPMVIPPGFVKTERPIRMWAADFADFGITAANVLNIDTFIINLKGTTDIAFIAYNFETAVVTPLTPGISLLKEGTYVDTNGDCIASVGDTVNYTFKVTNTGQTILTDLMVNDPSVTVNGGPLTLAPGASNQTNFTASYTLTQADINAGAVYNQATITGISTKEGVETAIFGISQDPTPVGSDSPFYNSACQFCTVTVLPQVPTISINSSAIAGCGVDAITGLAFSETAVNITLAHFIAAGGVLSFPLLNPAISYVDVQAGSCPTVVTRTFTILADCFPIVVTQEITIGDDTNPTASNPADIVITNANDPIPAPDVNVVTDEADNCSTPTVTFLSESTPVAEGCVETSIRTYTVTDECGNSINVFQNIIRNTTAEPIVPVLADIVANCEVTVPIPSATDSCGNTIVGTTTDPLVYTQQGTYTVIFTFNFGNNVIETATQTIIIDEDATPSAPVLADITAQCSAIVPIPTVTDSCSKATIVGTTNDPLVYNEQGTFIVHFMFDYGDGVVVKTTQNVIIDDVMAPAVPALLNILGECSATVTLPTTTDNCAGTVTATTTDALTYNVPGTYTVIFTFNDGNGNITTVPQQVTVTDTAAPIAPVLATITEQCSATVTLPTANDACGGVITATTTDPLEYTAQGTYTVTYTFTDASGNSVQATQTVIVDDTIAPVAPTLSAVSQACSITVTAPTTTDNCAGTITGTTSDPTTYNVPGTYTISWTFDDGNGNSVMVNQSVTVTTNSGPIAPVLATIVEQCSATVTTPTTTDGCGGTITGTTTDPTTYTTQGTFVINWTFTDGSGNSVSSSQTVIVDDTAAPVTPALANATGECTVTVTPPTATDNCAGTITGTTTDQLTYNTQGTFTITWIFDDGNGNSIPVTQTVIVDDVTAPVAPTLADVTGVCTASATAPTVTDNCGGIITGTTTDATTYTTAGTFTIIWTFDDGNGQQTTAPQNVIVTPSGTVSLSASAPCNALGQDVDPVDLAALLPANTPAGGVWTDVDGSGGLQGTTFVAGGIAVGTYTISYVVTDGACPTTIEIDVNVDDDCGIVLPCGNVEVYNAFSPNNDGTNDSFTIRSINEFLCYPTNNVEIYNRYGVLVYETTNYDNANNSFKGISEGRANIGDELPTGTYFYIVQYTTSEGNTVSLDGYLYLSR